MYVLVSGRMPRYEIQGWVYSVELVNPSNLSDNGYGEHYHMEQSQLREWTYGVSLVDLFDGAIIA